MIKNELADYQFRSYEDLSHEFKNLYPSAIRAFQLIPTMYNRLTLVDSLSHKAALTKIREDHKHLSGFSTRNLYRYLPSDNLHIPRRAVTLCHKFSNTKTDGIVQLSRSEQPARMVDAIVESQNENNGKDKRIRELENDLKQYDHDLKDKKSQNAGLLAQVEFLRKQLPSSDKHNNANEHPSNDDEVIDFEASVPWKTMQRHLNILYKSGKPLVVWFNGKIDRITGNVITAYPGRISERNKIENEEDRETTTT
jgi:hypothetical protein